MFGLENKRRDDGDREQFDLEAELKKPDGKRKVSDRVRQTLQRIKDILRTGESQESFNDLGVLLHGYVALLKLVDKVKTK